MTAGQGIELRRDCPAVLVPGGQRAVLHQGSKVFITQQLGGSLTVQVDGGPLVRIDGADADALGLEGLEDHGDTAHYGEFVLDQVIERLRTVYDPEIPINVVDLGLVYSCEAKSLPDGSQRVEITMSVTAPGCGMGDVLREAAQAKVQALPGVSEVEVEIVWDPPWDLSRLSDEARLQLGMDW